MNKLVAVFAVLAVVALAVLGLSHLLPDTSADANIIDNSTVDGGTGSQGPASQQPLKPAPQGQPATSEPNVTERVEQGTETADLPQGVYGSVISSTGVAVAGADVFLLRDVAPTDLIQYMLRMSASSRPAAAVEAKTKTDSSGRFQLGAHPTRGAAGYQLHIVKPGYVIHKEKLRLSEKERKNVGPIRLEKGKFVEGTIRDKTTKAPISDAEVWVKTAVQDGFLIAAPGLEDGVMVRANQYGQYRCEGLPQGKPLTIKALARGYSAAKLDNVTIAANETSHTENIELGKGFEIEGQVFDEKGNPIRDATITAVPYSDLHPTDNKARSDKGGRFAILGLSEGQYTVTAQAAGYVERPTQAVKAGTNDLRIMLEKQGSILLTVRQHSGRPVTSYRVDVRTYFEGQETFGKFSKVPAVEVRNKHGRYELSGLDPAGYVVEINALNFAKTYSEPFSIVEGQTDPIPVTVTMNEGGKLAGRVVGPDGKGIPGVKVKTLANNFQSNPFTDVFQSLIHVKITEDLRSTDSQGRFLFPMLTPGEYQLKFDHPAYTLKYKKDFKVEEGRTTDIGSVELSQGGAVAGTVFYAGRPVSQAKVTVSSSDPNAQLSVFETAFTDKDGKFTIQRPLPPGDYKVQAQRTTGLSSPLLGMVDLQRSEQKIQVFAGQTRRVTIQIPQ